MEMEGGTEVGMIGVMVGLCGGSSGEEIQLYDNNGGVEF